MPETLAASVPRATYRLQLTPSFGFSEAAEVCGYLASLGVSHLYSSPILQARRGSEHGYDVVDPARVDEGRGGEAGFAVLREELARSGLLVLLDIVPNHMAASHENPWWWDVLRHGPASSWADYFDVDWWPPHLDLQGTVSLPVLGDHYGRVLERGELTLSLDDELVLRYFDRRFPLDPRTIPPLIDEAADAASSGDAEQALRILAAELRSLPPRRPGTAAGSADGEAVAAAERELERLLGDGACRRALEAALTRWNGSPGEPSSYDRLDELLVKQPYRLAYWKVAAEEINYRRFFDIGDLIALRVEREPVFVDTHAVILRLAREGVLGGVRVDHVDGLRDPEAYLERLANELGQLAPYRVVEKILGVEEHLPDSWPVAGTTGYDFLNALNAIYIDPAGLRALDRAYTAFLGEHVDWGDLLYRKKRQVIIDLFTGELRALERMLARLARFDRHARDVGMPALGQALLEVSACLSVYRTYWRGWDAEPDGVRRRDRDLIGQAIEEARRRAAELDEAALDFVARSLAPHRGSKLPRRGQEEVVLRWQQFTGPATAKGLEDTTLYLFNRLVSMNAVGSEPGDVDVSVTAFHAFQARRATHWPTAMSATSTHDSKRSEDVRARINVLSELPHLWVEGLPRWRQLNAERREEVAGSEVPHPNEEVLLYQTLLGSWPLSESGWPGYPERIAAFMVKAAREAKMRSSWLRVEEEYEAALCRFVHGVLDETSTDFRAAFLPLQERLAKLGALNSLSQLVLKCASPGVPDFYQGTDLWDFSLVDPDNRRAVDFEARRALLEDLQARAQALGAERLIRALLQEWKSGAIKLFVTRRCLAARGDHPALFLAGDYQPLIPHGARGGSVVAFLRRHSGGAALAVAGLRFACAAEAEEWARGEAAWQDTALDIPAGLPGRWRDALTDRVVDLRPGTARVAELLAQLPFALLLADD